MRAMSSMADITDERHQVRKPTLGAQRAAIEAALVEGHRRIFGYLVGRLKNADEATDVLQEFSLRAIKRAGDLRDVQSVRGWLRRLLETAILDHYRLSNRRRQQELPPVPSDEETHPDASPDVDGDITVCLCLRDVIALLPSAAADVVRRIDLEEQSRKDVARALDISEGNLAVRLHRARAKLRDLLVNMCLTCPEHGFLDCACDRARALRLASGGLVGRNPL